MKLKLENIPKTKTI